jgi:hypothetical protein
MNEITVFPMAPAPFTGESREVEPGACFDWLHQGWAMFLANPGVWIGSTVLLLVILIGNFHRAVFRPDCRASAGPVVRRGHGADLPAFVGSENSRKSLICSLVSVITPGNW